MLYDVARVTYLLLAVKMSARRLSWVLSIQIFRNVQSIGEGMQGRNNSWAREKNFCDEAISVTFGLVYG